MSKSLKEAFRQLDLADEIALVACGEICKFVPGATGERIHAIDVTTSLFGFENRYTRLAGTGAGA